MPGVPPVDGCKHQQIYKAVLKALMNFVSTCHWQHFSSTMICNHGYGDL